jgi:rare lipoprotein A
VKIGESERGIASWYGDPYHGRKSANGEVFNMNEKTAAHRTMPFGTWLEVENESNKKRVNVRITDRGPFVGDRIIDLSRRAAEEIAMIGPGTAMVKLTVIEAPHGEVVEKYGVQVAAWENRAKAEELKKEIERVVKPVRVVEREGKPVLYRVIAGEGTREEAEAIARKLVEEGHRGFVTRHVP